MSAISDGTSNTVVWSESLGGKDSDDVETKVRIGVAPLSTGGASTPNDCLATKGIDGDFATGVTAYSRKGVRWAHSSIGYSGFQTILPPNSPSCTDSGTTWAVEQNGYIAASSNHSGGVVAGLLDGSVRFVSDTIDWGSANGDTRPTSALTGESPFGVWGAAGEESTSLP